MYQLWKWIFLGLIVSVQSYTYYDDSYYEEENSGLETKWIVLIIAGVFIKIFFWAAVCAACSRRHNRAVYVIHPAQRSAQIAARAGGGDAALYPAQNYGKTIIVNNDWNAQSGSYI